MQFYKLRFTVHNLETLTTLPSYLTLKTLSKVLIKRFHKYVRVHIMFYSTLLHPSLWTVYMKYQCIEELIQSQKISWFHLEMWCTRWFWKHEKRLKYPSSVDIKISAPKKWMNTPKKVKICSSRKKNLKRCLQMCMNLILTTMEVAIIGPIK